MNYEITSDAPGWMMYRDHVEERFLRVRSEELAGMVRPAEVHAAAVPDVVQDALAHPVGNVEPLHRLARGARRVAIIVSDSTRSVPTPILLDEVMKELDEAGLSPQQVRVVVATGVHRDATADEMAGFLGPTWAGHLAIENHRPRDDAHLVKVGRTRLGTDLFINRTVAESDLRIALGQVEPHEFAGFTGGPKSILPGVAGESTIRKNHAPERLLEPLARPGVLSGNPIWEEMIEAASLARLDFIVNVVMTPDRQLAGVVAGEVGPAHRRATDLYGELYGVLAPDHQARIAITTPGPPLNLNLYQSVKAIIGAEAVVADGGVVILYSRCTEGTGGDLFVEPYRRAHTPDEVIAFARRHYRIEMDHAVLLAHLEAQRGLHFVVATPGVDERTLQEMRFHPAPELERAYAMAREIVGGPASSKPDLLIFPQPQKWVIRRTGSAGV